jgi:hypothetical protein
MILNLFDHLFNPLMITHMRQDKNDVWIYFPDGSIEIENAQVYDIAATINQAIKDFHDNKA